MNQVSNPVITGLLVEELHVKSQIPKPTAKNTPLRYSSTFSCGRQQGYAAFDADPTEPMDHAGAWVTGLGTIVHEALQDAISRRFPSAQFEVPSMIGDFISGSCDALISTHDVGSNYGGTHVLYELKTMGTYAFDKQVGWNRLRGTISNPQGPAGKAVAQAGLNALGIEGENPEIRIETLVMGSIGFEALSQQKAKNLGIEGVNRFLAEFEVPREEWEPLAIEELKRLEGFAFTIDTGYLPDRWAQDDDNKFMTLDPNGRAWQCEYCAFKSVCMDDGPGVVKITTSAMTKRESK
jgi:hypothetical protein